MTKPIPAIVESAYEPVFAEVRALHSQLREAEAQLEKTAKRYEAAKGAVELRRRELGLALVKARQAWPERGPKAKGWGEFLEREGISQSTAWRLMEEFGPKDFIHVNENSPHPDAPHPADGADRASDAPVPSNRRPLGLLSNLPIYLGRWQDVLSEDEVGTVDTIITDAPYSAATHSGGREAQREDGYDDEGLAPDYTHWSADDIDPFVDSWSPRNRGWFVALSDHHLIGAWTTAFERNNRYVFAPVPCVIQGMTVRLAGDGPSSWTVYAIVARPRSLGKWGTLPGAYMGGREPGSKGGRGKPRWLIDALVRDYSRKGDLVCDPLAGYGTTLISALLQGRRAVGAEVDESACNEAQKRADALNEEPITEATETAA
ncbi:MAG TPA: DNA methyltransferase [Kofleriaceae bacterium]|jgi:hypothetical protein